jgi:hypothetical protein
VLSMEEKRKAPVVYLACSSHTIAAVQFYPNRLNFHSSLGTAAEFSAFFLREMERNDKYSKCAMYFEIQQAMYIEYAAFVSWQRWDFVYGFLFDLTDDSKS